MTFRVGQQVVAIRTAMKRAPNNPTAPLLLGEVYTIRDIDVSCVDIHGMATIRVEEVVNNSKKTNRGMWEPGYRPDGFRPIVEKKTDIGIFTAMLNPTKARERA